MQIIILGMHRSGTSLVTRLVNMLGAYVGAEKMMIEHRTGKLSDGNARGHWERQDVMDINDAILKHHAARWDAPLMQSPPTLSALPAEIKNRLELLVYGLDANRPWAVKDPRLCLTLPCWKPLLDVPVAVLVYRHPAQIAASLLRRNSMPMEQGLALWEYYIGAALNASINMPRVFVNHESLMQNPVFEVQQLYENLVNTGVRRLEMPSVREITAFVNPALNRAANIAQSNNILLNANQQHLVQLMQHGLPQIGSVQCSEQTLLKLTNAT
jgi:hypothetical protein